MNIYKVQSLKVGEAHDYYDIFIQGMFSPAKADDLVKKLEELLKYKCIICDDIFPHEHSFIEWLAYYTDHPSTGIDKDGQ